jgi:MHS family proline/betaine transporter-like MFS transporter
MGVSTLLIGFLPTYQEFGIFSPMLLIFLRLLQGLSCGGEFIGSMIFVLEHKKNYFFSALPWTGAILGTLLSSLIIMCISALGLNEFQDWGWRIPFWIGAITLIIGLYTRMKISESPETEKLKEQKKIVGSPLLIIFKKHTREIIRIILINIYLAAASYLVIAYMPTYLSKFCKMSFHQAILLNTFLIFNLIIFIPLFSILGKNIRDPKKALAFSAIILIIFILPIYDLLLSKSTLLHFLSLSLTALIIAPAMALTPIIMIDYLSPEIRYTGLAISYNIAYSIFGGAIPLMATYLIHLTNNFFIPSYIIIIAGVITLLGLFLKSNKNYNTITF